LPKYEIRGETTRLSPNLIYLNSLPWERIFFCKTLADRRRFNISDEVYATDGQRSNPIPAGLPRRFATWLTVKTLDAAG